MIVELVEGVSKIFKLYRYTYSLDIKYNDSLTGKQMEQFKTILTNICYYKISISTAYDKIIGLDNFYMQCVGGKLVRIHRDKHGALPISVSDDISTDELEIFLGRFLYDEENNTIKHSEGGVMLNIIGDKFRYGNRKYDSIDYIVKDLIFQHNFPLRNLLVSKDTFCYRREINTRISNQILIYELHIGSQKIMYVCDINYEDSVNGLLAERIEQTEKLLDNIQFFTRYNGEVVKGCLDISNSEKFVVVENKYMFYVNQDKVKQYLNGNDISNDSDVKLIHSTKSARK